MREAFCIPNNKVSFVCPTHGQNCPYLDICLYSLDTVIERPEPRFQCPAEAVTSENMKNS